MRGPQIERLIPERTTASPTYLSSVPLEPRPLR
jgi:hypothetical protein